MFDPTDFLDLARELGKNNEADTALKLAGEITQWRG